jgi:hypothetical protein
MSVGHRPKLPWALGILLVAGRLCAGAAFATECPLPPGVVVQGNNITGTVLLPLGGGDTAGIRLFVLNDGTPYANNQCPGVVYENTAQLLIDLYTKFVARGITKNNMRILVNSISGMPGAGVYIRPTGSASGYSGFSRTITTFPGTAPQMQGTIAHENMHGWEFQFNRQPSGREFYKAFAHFANLVYQAETANPGSLSGNVNGQAWHVDYLTYGLQNEAEWGSEVFADWALGGVSRGVWPYIDAHQPAYQAYFTCLWTTDTTPTQCAQALAPPVHFAANDPVNHPPVVARFTPAQSQAIWNVCFHSFRQTASKEDFATVDQLVASVAPRLPGSPSHSYQLAYGDCDHDGNVDWLCWYEGPGPVGVGNGQYLWNRHNKDGAYTFIATGNAQGTYAEYTQDPYSTLPSMSNGALAQPRFREWQGTYGSCNGAQTFAARQGPWYPAFAAGIGHGPPDTTVDSGPASPTTSPSATFSFSGTDDATPAEHLHFACRLDGGAFVACTSPQTYAALPEGSHTFQVQAMNAAGTVDPTPASFTWLIDLTAPVLVQQVAGDLDADGTMDEAGLTDAGALWVKLGEAAWHHIAAAPLRQLVAGDFEGWGHEQLVVLDLDSYLYLLEDVRAERWRWIPGRLQEMVVLHGWDGQDHLTGIDWLRNIWQSWGLGEWYLMPGQLDRVIAGDFTGAGYHQLAGIGTAGTLWWTPDNWSWYQLPGLLQTMQTVPSQPDGMQGLDLDGLLWHAASLGAWHRLP